MILTPYIDLVVLIVAATVLGILASRLKQPTLIAYLLSGLIVGPGLLGLVKPSYTTEVLAELGLMFLLFLVGLELDFGEIEHIIGPVLKISFGSMILVSLVGTLIPYILGFDILTSILLGLAFMYSSTAVVTKLLNDKNEVSKEFGRLNIGNLLVQDLVFVILMIFLTSIGQDSNIFEALTKATVFLLLAMPLTFLASKKILPRLTKFMAVEKVPLFITSIFWLFVFVGASEFFGMGLELGAFIAGLSLGQLDLSIELKEEVRPLTNFFIALFFVNFGLSLSIGDFLFYWKESVLIASALIISKFAFISGITKLFYDRKTAFNSGVTMSQTSEFSLVFAAAAASAGFLSAEHVGTVSLVAIITMTVSSYLILYHGNIYRKVFSDEEIPKSDKESHALILGYEKSLENILPDINQFYNEVIVISSDNNLKTNMADEEGIEFVFGNVYHNILRSDMGVGNADFVMVNIEDSTLQKEVLDEMKEKAVFIAKGNSPVGEEGSNTYWFEQENLIGDELKNLVSEKLKKKEVSKEE